MQENAFATVQLVCKCVSTNLKYQKDEFVFSANSQLLFIKTEEVRDSILW